MNEKIKHLLQRHNELDFLLEETLEWLGGTKPQIEVRLGSTDGRRPPAGIVPRVTKALESHLYNVIEQQLLDLQAQINNVEEALKAEYQKAETQAGKRIESRALRSSEALRTLRSS